MGKFSIFKEFMLFMKVSRNWWLLPIVVILLGTGLLIVLSQGSALAPVIYAMF